MVPGLKGNRKKISTHVVIPNVNCFASIHSSSLKSQFKNPEVASKIPHV